MHYKRLRRWRSGLSPCCSSVSMRTWSRLNGSYIKPGPTVCTFAIPGTLTVRWETESGGHTETDWLASLGYTKVQNRRPSPHRMEGKDWHHGCPLTPTHTHYCASPTYEHCPKPETRLYYISFNSYSDSKCCCFPSLIPSDIWEHPDRENWITVLVSMELEPNPNLCDF